MDFKKKPLGTETRPTDQPAVTESTATPTPIAVEKPYPRKRILVWRIIVTTLLVISAAMLVMGYFYIQSLYTEMGKLDAQLSQAHASKPAAVITGGKDFVPQSAIDSEALKYLKANDVLSASGQVYVDKIMYMTDRFARVDILKSDPNDKAKLTLVSTYFLKNVADATADKNSAAGQQWTVIWSEPLTDTDKKYLKTTYSVTDDVFTTIREE